ncbi:uncharacterized protein LOC132742018 [Ruditapes philippinarum]|uniref:uncharacterized protein LOC132742018 n=1 Tax=Ruditapes philippinarum TaxID=129788 RepID=UPI00295B0DCB|nr:uncharacterized protein LOC132742018 [Ruditapes philippinarum]
MGSNGRIYQVNLGELVENYIWGRYKHDTSFIKRLFLRRSNHLFDIRWGYVDFKHAAYPENKKQQTIQPTASEGSISERAPSGTDVSDIDGQMENLVPQDGKSNKRDIELYYSIYENETDTPQKYTFTASRETTSSTKFELQENYTLGAETNLEINLAEIVKIGGKVSGEYSITETKAEEFTKTLSWNINTEIEVPSRNKVKASLLVYEIPTKTSFVVKTTISIPTGNLPVTIRRKDGKEVHTEWINDLGVLFDADYINRSTVKIIEKKIVKDDGDEVIDNQIILTTRGVCRNISFMNQYVKVECIGIERQPEPVADDKDKADDTVSVSGDEETREP